MTDYRLEQVADYLCTIELALVKYEAKEDGETYNKFFGGIGSFKRNWLKQARSKRIQLVSRLRRGTATFPPAKRQTTSEGLQAMRFGQRTLKRKQKHRGH